MDDGGLGSNGELILHTHSYTTSEIERLIIALSDNFGIHSRITLKRAGQWMLVIPKREVHKVQTMCLRYMCPSLYYKLGM